MRRPTLRRPSSSPLAPGLVVLLAWLGGCSTATLPDEEVERAPDAPEAPGAAGSDLTGCNAEALCPDGLTCVGGVCLRFCHADADCGTGSCVPFPGDQLGFCNASTAPAPPDGFGGTPSGPAPDAPGEADPPPPDDPGAGGTAPPVDPPQEPDGPGDKPDPPTDEEPPPDSPPETPAEPEPPPPADCRYPAAGNEISVGGTMPHFRWATAVDGAGNTVDFDLERFHCDPMWDRYSVLAFVVGTGWCSACVEYDGQLAGLAASFEAAGGLFVFVEVEDAGYNPADSADAARIIEHSYGNGPGLRVGDADTQPSAMAVGQSSIVQSYPSAFVVRRSDMQVIADQNSSAYTLDYVQLARDAASGPGPSPDPGPVGGDCTEEPGEPNDAAGQAVPLAAGELSGGVCGADADFYRVSSAGWWHIDLRFSHAQGDLDLYVWDAARNDVAVGLNGRPLGSDSADDDEAFDGFGPATIQIVGYEGAHAPYRLRFAER